MTTELRIDPDTKTTKSKDITDDTKTTKSGNIMDDITPGNILEIYKKVWNPIKRDSNSFSFLDLAVEFNDVNLLAILLKDENMDTCIGVAMVITINLAAKKRNNLPILKLLCDYIKTDSNLQNIAIFDAVQECNIEFVQLLLPYINDINNIKSSSHGTLIQTCLESDRKIEEIVDMFNFLIQHGAKYNIFEDFRYHVRNIDCVEIQRLLFFNYPLKLTNGEVIETKDGKFKLITYDPSKIEVKIVMDQAGCSKENAENALIKHNGDIVSAISDISGITYAMIQPKLRLQ